MNAGAGVAAPDQREAVDFRDWVEAVLDRVEAALQSLLPGPDMPQGRLHEAMRYSVLGGGKRIRPLLVFAAGELGAARPDRLEAAACAVECIHAYSLVHDDLPCMDDDVLRRGQPTTHVRFDEATALLAGDALQTLAFEALAAPGLADDARVQVEMLRLLAEAAGSRGMAGGQAIDLQAVGRALSQAELENMHVHKTGALIRVSVALGARCGALPDAAGMAALQRYARAIGLAFQVVDDVLDAEADTATLGKTAGKDAAQGKPTYVSLLGVERARALAEELRRDAHQALQPFGARGRRLAELADLIVLRKF